MTRKRGNSSKGSPSSVRNTCDGNGTENSAAKSISSRSMNPSIRSLTSAVSGSSSSAICRGAKIGSRILRKPLCAGGSICSGNQRPDVLQIDGRHVRREGLRVPERLVDLGSPGQHDTHALDGEDRVGGPDGFEDGLRMGGHLGVHLRERVGLGLGFHLRILPDLGSGAHGRSARCRCRRGRRGLRRPLPAPPPSRSRAHHPGLRGGRRRRRHLVLESLPGRALRRREHGVLATGSPRSSSRSGSGPSATPRSPRSCATSNTSPIGSISGATSQFDTRVRSPPPSTSATAAGPCQHRQPAHEVPRPVLRDGHGLPVVDQHPRHSTASTRFEGADLPHRAVAPRGRRLRRQARGVIGTGSSGVQSIPIIADQADAAGRVPAHRDLRRAGPQPRRSTRPSRPRSRRTTPGSAAANRQIDRRVRVTHARQRQLGARRPTPEERRREFERAVGAPAGCSSSARSTTCSSTPPPTSSPPTSCATRSATSCDDPEVAELLSPDHRDRLQAALRRHRLLRDLQPAERAARRRERRRRSSDITPDRPAGRRTSTYELDIIVFATGFDAMTGALLAIDITGADGTLAPRRLVGRSRGRYLGLGVAGFPNLFTSPGRAARRC